MDSFHLASTAEVDRKLFLTNDSAIKHPSPGLEILMLSDFEPSSDSP
jgi:hypothetical protein